MIEEYVEELIAENKKLKNELSILERKMELDNRLVELDNEIMDAYRKMEKADKIFHIFQVILLGACIVMTITSIINLLIK